MSGLFKQKPPKVEDPARMPDEEDPAVMEARRKRAQDAQRRGGRASTILSDLPGTKLGGAG